SPEEPQGDEARPSAGVEDARARGKPPVHAVEELLHATLPPEDAEPGVVEIGDAAVFERRRVVTVGAAPPHVKATRATTVSGAAGTIDRSSSVPSRFSASAVQLSTQSPVLQ